MAFWGTTKSDSETAGEKYDKQLKEDMTRLTNEANASIQIVKDAQPPLLERFMADWKADIAAWSFRCERWGDFLAVFKTSRGQKYNSDYVVVGTTVRSQMSIRLDAGMTIQFVEGHAPDLLGRDSFGFCWKNNKRNLAFNGVDLLSTSRQCDYYWSSSDGSLPVEVDGIARPEEPDKIVFGAGGGSPWEDVRGPGMFTPEQERIWKQERPGTTLLVPASLGEGVYAQVLLAMKTGAP